MKLLHLTFMFTLIILFAGDVHAAEKAAYQTGKLVDLRRRDTGNGAARAQGSFCLSVEMLDVTYLLREEAFGRWSYQPTDFIVGDPVKVRIQGTHMYLVKPKGGEFKTRIVRRERNTPDRQPVTCGLPVSETD